MALQRKEELMKELDTALNRKVQEKYFKMTNTQNLIGKQTANDHQLERIKKDTNIEGRGYRSKDNFSKSPANVKPNEMGRTKRSSDQFSPTFSGTNLMPERGPSPHFDQRSKETSREHFQALVPKLKEQIVSLQRQNSLLTKELASFKSTIRSLQQSSKILKRDEQEYISMKETTDSLIKQIQFLKNKEKKMLQVDKKLKTSDLTANLNFQEHLKQIMMHLNISFVNKQWNQDFISDSMRTISKEVLKMNEEKAKLVSKLNKFDIESVLAKENNVSYKQEINALQLQVQNYEAELSACNTTIKQLQQQFNSVLKDKKLIQNKYKQTLKEIESSKRQVKMMIESSKHRKPKRESSVLKKDRESTLIQSTVFRQYLDSEAQTEPQTEIKESLSPQIIEKNKQITDNLKREVINLQENVTHLKNKEQFLKQKCSQGELDKEQLQIQIVEMREQNSGLKANISDLQQKIRSMDEQNRSKIAELESLSQSYCDYIKQLQSKSQEINRDISMFMPQLKQMEEENNLLKQNSLKKDEEIIRKYQVITEVSNQKDLLMETLVEKDKSIAQLQFQLQKEQIELKRLNSQIGNLAGENSQLQESMLEKQSEMKNFLGSRIQDLQNERDKNKLKFESTLQAKEAQIKNLHQQREQMKVTVDQLLLNVKDMSTKLSNLTSQVQKKELAFIQQKEKMRDAIQQIMILNRQLAKKQTQYESQYNAIQNKTIAMQSQSLQVTQSYGQLEATLRQMDRELKSTREENERLKDKAQEVRREIQRVTLAKKQLEVEINGSAFLQKQLSTIIDDLRSKASKLQDTISKITQQNTENKHKISHLLQQNQTLSGISSQMQQSGLIHDNQLKSLHFTIESLQRQNKILSQQSLKIKQSLQSDNKAKTEKLSNQSYDIERLIRQNRTLQNQIQQLTSLSESKSFQEGEISRQLQELAEENKTLTVRNQYLAEELEMKQRNKEEDQYITELKYKQYSLLVKKILGSMIELGDLQGCMELEILLEVGSQRVVERKREIMDLQLKEQENQYELNRGEEPRKRFNFGVEVSSYEQLALLSSRNKEIDSAKEQQWKGSKVNQPLSSPRSIILKLSPSSPEPQLRTDRLISQYRTHVRQGTQ